MSAFEGKTVLVVGEGVPSRPLAEAAVSGGGRVFLATKDLAGAGRLIARLGHNQVDATAWHGDADCARAVAAAARRFGGIDVAVTAVSEGEAAVGALAAALAPGVTLVVVAAGRSRAALPDRAIVVADAAGSEVSPVVAAVLDALSSRGTPAGG